MMMILNAASLDFGYPWWLSYGHALVLTPAAVALGVGFRRGWPRWTLITLLVIVLWAMAAMGVVRIGFNANGKGTMPASSSFFTAGKGRVLDIGAGTGRSSIMLLEARPQATLVATDLFGNSFDQHFGASHSHGDEAENRPQERLRRNLVAAGVAERATIETADMRKLPFEAASFDAAISAYAMDHLPRTGIEQALREAARVLKPGGEFLLMLAANDGWAKFAYGPLLSHGGVLRNSGWWKQKATEAGFQVKEEGTAPVTLYLVLVKPS